MYEANRAIRNHDLILCAERSKKRGRKRQNAQRALEVSVFGPLNREQGLFDAPANAFLHAHLVRSRRLLLLHDAPNEVP